MNPIKGKLSQKAEMVCQYYVNERLSKEDAYIKAGYSHQKGKSTFNVGNFFSDPKVLARIDELRKSLIDHIDKDSLLKQLKDIATDPMSTKKDKMRALEMIGKWCGLEAPTKIEQKTEIITLKFEEDK